MSSSLEIRVHHPSGAVKHVGVYKPNWANYAEDWPAYDDSILRDDDENSYMYSDVEKVAVLAQWLAEQGSDVLADFLRVYVAGSKVWFRQSF